MNEVKKTDWEKRALAVLEERRVRHNDEVPYATWPTVKAMLQLGLEMADARAEEIAKAIERRWMHEKNVGMGEGFYSGLHCGIASARSTIQRQAPLLSSIEMQRIPKKEHGLPTSDEVKMWTYKARGQVLEEALREAGLTTAERVAFHRKVAQQPWAP